MILPALNRLRTQPAWLWLLLAMGVVGWGSGRAEASCGDYVLIGNRHVVMEMEGHRAPSFDATQLNGYGGSRKPGQPVPCHGPQCRQRKAPKGLPVSTVVSLERSDAVLSELVDLSPVLQPNEQALAVGLMTNQMPGRGLYRPPRVA
jgi:hypothetical protein